MQHRREVTQTIIDLLPGSAGITVEQALKTWYYNIRINGGFRLTNLGYQALRSAAVSSWSIDIQSKDITKKRLLVLDHKLTWPYYIDLPHKKLILFSSRDAVMASLYGDVKSWLDSLV